MSPESTSAVSDKGRLLFAAGFAFGVMFAMFVLAVVAATVVDGRLISTDVYITIAGGVLFTGIVGISLYLLAFPENRLELPVEELVGPDDEEE